MNESERTAPNGISTHDKPKQGPFSGALVYLHDLAYLIAIMLVIFLLVFRVVVVSGPSMQPGLLDGDYLLLLSGLLYPEPEQGDVVVLAKDSFEDGQPIVKRVIATAGQHVRIDYKEAKVFVDGVALDDSYTFEPGVLTDLYLNEGIREIVVQDGCVFVMGDNRNHSLDSRSPLVALVDKREILGKAIFLFIPGTDPDTANRDFGRIGGV